MSLGIYSRFTIQSTFVQWSEESIPDWITISGSAISKIEPENIHPVSLRIPVFVRVQELSKIPELESTPELLTAPEEVLIGIFQECRIIVLSENIFESAF